MLRTTSAAAVVALSLLSAAAPVLAKHGSDRPGGYAYAGLFSDRPAAGVAATITPTVVAELDAGHVAAWVNVGDRRGWLQVGMNAAPGRGQQLYLERGVWNGGEASTDYRVLEESTPLGVPRRLALVETSRDRWAVYVDGRQVAEVVAAGSSSWVPSVSAESYRPDVGSRGVFGYRLARVSTRPHIGDRWQPGAATLWRGVDPGYRLVSAGAGALEARPAEAVTF